MPNGSERFQESSGDYRRGKLSAKTNTADVFLDLVKICISMSKYVYPTVQSSTETKMRTRSRFALGLYGFHSYNMQDALFINVLLKTTESKRD